MGNKQTRKQTANLHNMMGAEAVFDANFLSLPIVAQQIC